MYDVIIIGAGISGLSLGLKLIKQQASFLILEKASEVGGTWRENTYPGCACDVESHLYNIKDVPNPDWTAKFASQHEIQKYLVLVSNSRNLRQRIRFDTTVIEAKWDSARLLWCLSTKDNYYETRSLVSAVGALHEPYTPDFSGLPLFKGNVIHTARWPSNLSLEGKRVAVIGTGASSIQVVPTIATQAKSLVVFQRTAPWIVPRHDTDISQRKINLFRRFPIALRSVRTWLYWRREVMVLLMKGNERLSNMVTYAAQRHLAGQVRDPQLMTALTPTYSVGCKRILLSDDYYPSLCRSNVTVVTDAINNITEEAIQSNVGHSYNVDTIIMATGFKSSRIMSELSIIGKDGIRLEKGLGEPMSAYLGMTISGYPNFFVMLGPNTGLGHSSVILMIEAQARYICSGIRMMVKKKVNAVDVKRECQDKYRMEMWQRLLDTVWQSGGCSSWYHDSQGNNVSMWPGFTHEYILRTRRFKSAQYNHY